MIIIKSICYIIGASDADNIYINEKCNHYIIAADRGLESLKNQGITPHLIVGDFDSLGYRPQGDNVICHKPEKDDTDTMLAVNEGISRGYDTFIFYGCLGGRLDHTIANINVLGYLADMGKRGYIVSENQIVTVIKNDKFSFMPFEEGYISVFSIAGNAEGVYEKGLKYSLENANLPCLTTLGVSNEFTGTEAEISVKNGMLAIMWTSSAKNLIDKYIKPED